MKIAVFSSHHFEKKFLNAVNAEHHHSLTFFEPMLNEQTAPLAQGFDGVCCFVSDHVDAQTLNALKTGGVRLIALRSAGYNNVDLVAAAKLGLTVVRVPAYSPHAVAEYAVGLLLSVNRKIHKAYMRVHGQNFSLEGLMGFDLYGKTVGVIGTGRIGAVFATIMKGFGCDVIAYDSFVNQELVAKKTVTYVSLSELYQRADVISLHVPLLPSTHHLVNSETLPQMKDGILIINTGRGALIDSLALIEALKSGKIGGAGLDVYEEEEGIFYKDLSEHVLKDDVLARLITFPNVLMTSHQAFLTKEALQKIAETTLQNITDFETNRPLLNQVQAKTHLVKE